MGEWLDEFKPLAYGPLRIRPVELHLLTPAELLDICAGHRLVQKQKRERDALLVSWIANTCGMRTKPLDPAELLGQDNSETKQVDRDKLRADFEELKAKHGG